MQLPDNCCSYPNRDIDTPVVIPYGLVGLWDMLQNLAFPFYQAVELMRKLERDAVSAAAISVTKKTPFNDEDKKHCRKEISELKGCLQVLRLHESLRYLAVAENEQKRDAESYDYGRLSQDIKRLQHYVQRELAEDLFFHVRQDKREYLTYSFTEAVKISFPSCTHEIESAGTCFAIGEWQACVFHLMRVLEIGLNSMCKLFSVPFARDNWHNVIEQVEKQIRGMNSSCGPDWKDKQKFYAQAASQFMFFKDAWRNHVMHVRDAYDEGKALSVFGHVRDFMESLTNGGMSE